MKSIISLVIALTLYANGDFHKGQTYYQFIVAPILGYDGKIFTKKYTKAKWKELYKNDGKGFYEEFNSLKGHLNKDILNDLEAFSIKYAKDSDATPICHE